MCLIQKLISCRQHITVSCFCSHSFSIVVCMCNVLYKLVGLRSWTGTPWEDVKSLGCDQMADIGLQRNVNMALAQPNSGHSCLPPHLLICKQVISQINYHRECSLPGLLHHSGLHLFKLCVRLSPLLPTMLLLVKSFAHVNEKSN